MPDKNENFRKIRPVILSGGSGTRLWPVSRQRYPKQFAHLTSDESQFSATLRRVADHAHYAAPLIVSNAEHKFFVLEALERLGIADAIILLEPMGRNTAAAAIIAALHEQEPTLHLVMPSDHLMTDPDNFHKSATIAAAMARNGHLVLFGMQPDGPETAYGYIVPGESIGGGPVRKIDLFTEKPDRARAASLLEQGALWNSGIFLYDPRALREEAEHLAPDHLRLCAEALSESTPDYRCIALGREAYGKMQNHAFDTLIMEKTRRGAVLPCAIGWDDIGSWHALWKLAEKDQDGNAVSGPAVTRGVKNSYIRSDGPLVAAMDMENCMIVATKDVVLVAPYSRAQEVKALLPEVEKRNPQLVTDHTCVPRPWGTYETVAEGQNFKVKHIVVRPGKSLSLQMHHHRSEHWVVVAGMAKVECNGEEKLVPPNESVFVPIGTKHRLSNPGTIDLQLIEVQSGDYLGEDDIVRFDDAYGRTGK